MCQVLLEVQDVRKAATFAKVLVLKGRHAHIEKQLEPDGGSQVTILHRAPWSSKSKLLSITGGVLRRRLVTCLFPLLTSPFNQLSSNPYVVTAPQETTGKNWEMTSVFFFPILLPPSSLSLAEPYCLASTHAHFESSRSFLSCCHPDMGIYVHLSLSCSNLSWALFTPMPIENLIPKSCCHKVLGTLRHLNNSQN